MRITAEFAEHAETYDLIGRVLCRTLAGKVDEREDH